MLWPLHPTGLGWEDELMNETMLNFKDARRGEAALVLLSGNLWVCFRHPDGQFVTERKATPADLGVIGDLLRAAETRIQELGRVNKELRKANRQ